MSSPKQHCFATTETNIYNTGERRCGQNATPPPIIPMLGYPPGGCQNVHDLLVRCLAGAARLLTCVKFKDTCHAEYVEVHIYSIYINISWNPSQSRTAATQQCYHTAYTQCAHFSNRSSHVRRMVGWFGPMGGISIHVVAFGAEHNQPSSKLTLCVKCRISLQST